MNGVLTSVFWAFGMFVMIMDSPAALAGAAEGVQLCIKTLIPGLFPLMVLSSMLSASIPRGGLMLAGILGGYPVGAANVARLWRSGSIPKTDAQRLLVLYNCAGPSFIFGAASGLHPLRLWIIYLVSVAALWLILPKSSIPMPRQDLTLPAALHNALVALARVCGWVVFMRSILTVADRWVLWLLPQWLRIFLCGLMELSNGMVALADVEGNLRFVLAAGMLGFGGICVMMQTAGVTQGLSMALYFPGKVFQCSVCIILAAMVSSITLPPAIWIIILTVSGVCIVFLRKNENICRNFVPLGV